MSAHDQAGDGTDERARFKAHFIAEGWDEQSFERYDIYDPDDVRSYKSRPVNDMWDGWQARAALARGTGSQHTADELARAWMLSHGYGNQSVGYALADLQSRIKSKDREGMVLARQVQALLDHCPDPECHTCGEIICLHSEPLHFHHDGCPACAQHEDAKQESSPVARCRAEGGNTNNEVPE